MPMQRWLWATILALAIAAWATWAPAAAQIEGPRFSNTPTPVDGLPTPLLMLAIQPTLPVLSPTPMASPTAPATATRPPSGPPTAAPPTAPTAPSVPASPSTPVVPAATPSDRGAELSALLLTQADLPPGLEYNPRMSGPLTIPGVQGYTAAFFASDPPSALAEGSLGMVMNVLQLFDGPELPPLEDVVRGAQGGMRLTMEQPGQLVVDEAFPLASPPVGEEAQAFAVRAEAEHGAFTTAMVVFRRESWFAYVAVLAIGEEPPTEVASRLAAVADARLRAASGAR
jgi:hypothetical protein